MQNLPNTRKYRVPGGYVCELCAESYNESGDGTADVDIWDLPANVQPLATTLMLASAQDNLSIATSLMEDYRARALRAEATLSLIRDEISGLCNGPYTPNPQRIREALYPTDYMINLRMEGNDND